MRQNSTRRPLTHITLVMATLCGALDLAGQQPVEPDPTLLSALSTSAATEQAWRGFRPPDEFGVCQRFELTLVVMREPADSTAPLGTILHIPGTEHRTVRAFEGRLPGLPPSCFTFRFQFAGRQLLAFPALDSAYSLRDPQGATTAGLLHEWFHAFQLSEFRGTLGTVPAWAFDVHEAGEALPEETLHGATFQRLAREERLLLAAALGAPTTDSVRAILRQYVASRAHRMRLLPEPFRGVEAHEERKEGTAQYASYVATFLATDGDLDRLTPTIQSDLRAPLDFAANGGGERGPWRSWHIYATGAALGVLLDRLGCEWQPAVAQGYTLFGAISRASGSPGSLADVVTSVPPEVSVACTEP
jgi:hypothetical protein